MVPLSGALPNTSGEATPCAGYGCRLPPSEYAAEGLADTPSQAGTPRQTPCPASSQLPPAVQAAGLEASRAAVCMSVLYPVQALAEPFNVGRQLIHVLCPPGFSTLYLMCLPGVAQQRSDNPCYCMLWHI